MDKTKFHLRLGRSSKQSMIYVDGKRLTNVRSATIGVSAKSNYPVLKLEISITPDMFTMDFNDSTIEIPSNSLEELLSKDK